MELNFLAPILKKRKPKVKAEPKVEVKQEVKVENKVEAKAKEEGQNTSSSSVPADMSDSSKKRKSPEADDQDKQAGGSQPEADQVPGLKKVKTTDGASSAHSQAEPASADSETTQPVPLLNEIMGKAAAGNADELAPDQTTDQMSAGNKDHDSLEACKGNDEYVTSEWEGFESDEDVKDGDQLSEAGDNAALAEGCAVGHDI